MSTRYYARDIANFLYNEQIFLWFAFKLDCFNEEEKTMPKIARCVGREMFCNFVFLYIFIKAMLFFVFCGHTIAKIRPYMKRILTEEDTDVTTTSENRKVNTNVIETRGRKKRTNIENN